METKVSIGAQLETDMARATPAIVIKPLTLSPDKDSTTSLRESFGRCRGAR